MMRIASVVLIVSFAALVSAQDTKWQPPPTPDGWKGVVGKDDRYRFATPKTAKSSGTRDRTYTSRGLRVAVQINYCTLADGAVLEVRSATLTGSELKGTTVDQMLDAFAETEKEEFFKIYQLDVVTIPTHRPNLRRDLPDRIYKTEDGKFRAVAKEVAAMHAAATLIHARTRVSFILPPRRAAPKRRWPLPCARASGHRHALRWR